jgi:hypothetical protein
MRRKKVESGVRHYISWGRAEISATKVPRQCSFVLPVKTEGKAFGREEGTLTASGTKRRGFGKYTALSEF